jgi:hypothetical protein
MSQKTIITVAVVWMLALIVMVLGVYLFREERKNKTEFAPLVDVCRGKWVSEASLYSPTPGRHPAVAVRDTADGLQLDSSLIFGLIPGEAQAQSLAETQVVLCVGKMQAIFIERCPYTMTDNSGVIKVIDRYYYKQEARLVEAKTGRVVAVQNFTGNSPDYCGKTEWFSKNDKLVHLTGSEVPESAVSKWAQAHLVIK